MTQSTDKQPPVIGHDDILRRFETSLTRGRLGSGYLFVGPPGIGKRTTANWIAQSLLCETTDSVKLEACGTCAACQQVLARSHPDFDVIEKPAEKSTIPVDLLIGDKNHRMREGLCVRVAMSPARGGRKIAIIDDADFLSQESANCLLKTLEEPPPRAVLILIGTSAQRQLPTIRSRCQVVSFRPLDQGIAQRLILAQGLADNEVDAARLAAASGGSLTKAAELNSPEIGHFHEELGQRLASNWQPAPLAKMILEFIDAAGKDAAPRRARQALVMELTAEFYRQALHLFVGVSEDQESQRTANDSAAKAAADWPHSAESMADCVERCLVAAKHVGANANQATNVETWIDDLWGIVQHGSSAPPYEYSV